jgi:hypothetical protein
VVAVGVVLPFTSAFATIESITTRPEAPTVCDPVGLLVKGTMPDPCYHLIGASLRGPVELPTMGPIPTYEIRIRLTVQEPNPDIDVACPTVLEPYERGFRLEPLPFGRYLVRATEYLVPFSPDSSADPKDSTAFDASFDVSPAGPCTPGEDCFMLSFGQAATPDSMRPGFCSALGRPGGEGCFDIALSTTGRVGGVQTQVLILNPEAPNRTPVPGDLLHPTSVQAVGRASEFQVGWTAEGSTLKVLLYSSTGGVIEPGDGPILHVCYAIASGARSAAYPMYFGETIVADPAGTAIMHCPTFAEIIGHFCIGNGATCDLNSDGLSDIRDIVLLVRCALSGGIGGTAECPDPIAGLSDCNHDGSVDVRDVICCVRATLDGPSGAHVFYAWAAPPPDPALTDIRFEGPVAWASSTLGSTTLSVRPGTGVAGVQLWVSSGWAGARVRGLALEGAPDGTQLEWTLQPSGPARAMLYRVRGGVALEEPIRIRVDVEPTGNPGGQPWLTVSGQAATADGATARAGSSAGSAIIPAPGTVAAPTVNAAAPNPFVSETEISYALPAAARVTLRIYDASGRLVRSLVDSSQPAGVHRARWDGRDAVGRAVASGIYFLKFSAGATERMQRVMRLR